MTTRKLLLLGTILTAFSVGPAMAGDEDWDKGDKGHHTIPTLEMSLAAAFAGNDGGVAGNSASAESQTTSTSITGGSYNGAKGVSNQNQNAGANSALQNALALSYIQGCSCAATGSGVTTAVGGALAVSGNQGEVERNSSSSSAERVGATYTKKPWTDGDSRDDFFKTIVYGPNSMVSASIDGSYNSVSGVFQVNQNSGANSLLQNAAAVAAANQLKGAKLDSGVAVALAGNDGEVAGNTASASRTNAGASINNSFNNATGVVNANQNVGANSELQNSASLASLQFCGCATDNLSLTVAAAGNDGGVWGNRSSAENGSNGASMNNSFNGSKGMLQANQNAGANSLLQNSVAVGSIIHTTSTAAP